jgi:hypothetical protein
MAFVVAGCIGLVAFGLTWLIRRSAGTGSPVPPSDS